ERDPWGGFRDGRSTRPGGCAMVIGAPPWSASGKGARRAEAAPREARGEAERLLHRAGVRAAGARDVERGPVVGRGAHEREAERDVHAAPEGDRLEGGHPDVVVGGDDGVEVAAERPGEDGVGGKGRP